MKSVVGVIIAFDNDNDLREITEHRTVSAVQWGGRYRVIDFMLSNMVNSGIYRVGVLMKDKYQSLIDHIGSAKDWDLSRKNSGITLLPPYSYSKKSSPLITGELRGKIDALAGAVTFLQKNRADYVVIADGDIVANIPLDDVIDRHEKSGADLTMVCAKKQQETLYTTYVELNRKKEAVDIRVGDSNEGKCKHVALGVYVMSRQFLIHMLSECVTHNCIHFEREFLSRVLIDGTVNAYLFNEYACKIENTFDYFRSNMDMLDKDVRDELFKRTRPILTRIKDEAPTYYGDKARVEDSLIADGCRIEGHVQNCVLFRDVEIAKGAEVRDCIIMEGGRIMSDAALRHVIADRDVIVREGRTMMGHENYPITLAKYASI
ncbi:MAG: glucose-1-phosphate adenylyltransferase subunit GlgD [Agathobaculum sp.]|uniref:glucose-1-phosphate adenylyltransferase subunit GlgD n=1 Tax=Agathobaculum sp. TaxID=2048138 RepID=UPI0025C05ACD|nr:glucose-1-phosphate adenylyltransferase subunit GlgD [Agathobaculum sp.]MCI7126205.1 glucose-1-phosphate adenylyltransferase subunit GlgD [Agathobaculum sp.]MDY3711380.1 glucose-1-phosphate adenylyltransferase subunit GlgD [Agathobaculum sp.]